jgi:hypothetical protein
MIRVDGDRVAFIAHESQEATDFNGDADISDRVVHLYDDADGSITNLARAQSFVMSSADLHLQDDDLAFLVYEPRQGSDLNGDLDEDDFVPHVYSISSATTANLGLEGRQPALGEGFVAFLVRESRQGEDLNGDLDQVDQVAHVYETDTGTLTNLGFDASSFQVGSSIGAFLARESPSNDLNGDGDFTDSVAHVYDSTTGSVINLGLATQGVRVAGRFVALLVSEADEGADLNGDSDSSDWVIHLYDGDTGTTTNLALAINGWVIGERLAAIAVSESMQGAVDLNGDGDFSDRVLHVFDRTTGTITNTFLDSSAIAVGGAFVAFLVSEWGGADLNGDGDAFDLVLHVYDAGSGTTSNLQLAAGPVLVAGNALVTFRVSEAQQGNVDRNGDGDTTDKLLHVLDTRDGSVTDLGLTPVGQSPLVNRRFGFTARESVVGRDLNGDGDQVDDVVHLYDGVRGELFNLQHATLRAAPVIGENLLAFSVREIHQRYTDLNGDGDQGDWVLHVVRLAESTPEELLEDLIDVVEGLGLHHGIENALKVKLEAALDALADDDVTAAEEAVRDFVNQVEAQAGKKISLEEADLLRAAAEEILALLPTGGG